MIEHEHPVAPTKQRPGDQPLPTPNDRPVIQDLVVADIQTRRELGVKRYGTALQPFNGRNSLQDLYEEILDAANYVRQVIYEAEYGDYSAFQAVLGGQLVKVARERNELERKLSALQAAVGQRLFDRVQAAIRRAVDGNGVVDVYRASCEVMVEIDDVWLSEVGGNPVVDDAGGDG